MTNAEIARCLRDHAAELARQGDNLYRVRAFRQAAFAIQGLPWPVETASERQLQALPGIGPSLANTILSYAKTDRPEHALAQ